METTELLFDNILSAIVAFKQSQYLGFGSSIRRSAIGYAVIVHTSPSILERELFVASVY